MTLPQSIQFPSSTTSTSTTADFPSSEAQFCMSPSRSRGSGRDRDRDSSLIRRGVAKKLQGASTPLLTDIYNPKSNPMPTSSKGIVLHALTVVADPAATHYSASPSTSPAQTSLDTEAPEAPDSTSPTGSTSEVNLKKVSKRRKKANGDVDVEHTKSSNEYLRKVQNTLRDSGGDSSSDDDHHHNCTGQLGDSDRDEEPTASNTYRPQHQQEQHLSRFFKIKDSSQNTSISRSNNPANNLEDSFTSDSNSNSNSNSDPSPFSLFRNQLQYSTVSKARNHLADEENSIRSKATASTYISSFSSSPPEDYSVSRSRRSTTSTEDLGYEDPDAAMPPTVTQKQPGMARRRGSVTEHTMRAAQAAQQAQLLDEEEQSTRVKLSSAYITSTTDLASRAAAAAKRLQNLQGFSKRSSLQDLSPSKKILNDAYLHRRSLSYGGRSTMASNDVVSSMQNEKMTLKTDIPSANPYGYEDPDVNRASQRSALEYEDPDSKTSDTDMYGYGDSVPQPAQRFREPPRRRGSVTKYSVDAAKSISAMDTFKMNEAFKAVLPSRSMDIEDNSKSSSASPCPQENADAPKLPRRKVSPWNTKGSTFPMQGAPLSGIHPIGPPRVHAPPSKSKSFQSFQSETSYRSNRSGDILYDSSDEEDSDSIDSASVSSDDGSYGETSSVISITIPLKDCSNNVRDGPMRPPARHNSMESYSSVHSSKSLGSDDGDSLAPDMRSLCSISHSERAEIGTSLPGPPMFLPRTPKADKSILKNRGLSKSNSGESFASADLGGNICAMETYVNTSPLPSPRSKKNILSTLPPTTSIDIDMDDNASDLEPDDE